jgi:hypothetical protein
MQRLRGCVGGMYFHAGCFPSGLTAYLRGGRLMGRATRRAAASRMRALVYGACAGAACAPGMTCSLSAMPVRVPNSQGTACYIAAVVERLLDLMCAVVVSC